VARGGFAARVFNSVTCHHQRGRVASFASANMSAHPSGGGQDDHAQFLRIVGFVALSSSTDQRSAVCVCVCVCESRTHAPPSGQRGEDTRGGRFTAAEAATWKEETRMCSTQRARCARARAHIRVRSSLQRVLSCPPPPSSSRLNVPVGSLVFIRRSLLE